MLSVFGDESHDPTKARVFAVAGLLGDTTQWQDLRTKWTARMGGLVFHAADCESGYGDFKNMAEPDRHRLHRDLTKLLADSRMFGWGCVIDIKGAKESFPDVMEHMSDMVHYDCFLKTVLKLCETASQFIPPERVEFTFDQHRETQYNAGLLYDWLQRHRPVAAEKISFATRKEIGVQAADLWARELMKKCDGHIYNPRTSPRPQWSSLSATGRFGGDFLLASYFSGMRAQMSQIHQRAGMNEKEYHDWILKNRLIDNMSNRFRYIAEIDKKLDLMKGTPGDKIEP